MNFSWIYPSFKIWRRKISLSIVDQALVSGASFIFNVLLARWLIPGEYGAFAVVFSIFLFFSGFHNALVLEPMSVIGSAKYKNNFPNYLGLLVCIQIILIFILSLILLLLVIPLSIKGNQILPALWGLIISGPFMLLFYFMRRTWYLKMRPEMAVITSLIYTFFLLSGLTIAKVKGWLSPFSAFIIMGLASLGTVLLLWDFSSIRLKAKNILSANPGIKSVFIEHWGYGKWIVGCAFVYWLIGSAYLPLIGTFAGLSEAGAFRAIQNLILPVNQILTALGLLFLPWVSAKRVTFGNGYLKNFSLKITVFMVGLTIAYLLLPIIGGRWLVPLFYGEGRYDSYLWLIPYLGGIALLGAATQGFALSLKAAKYPNTIFFSQAGGAFVTLTLGIVLVRKLGLLGAAVGNISAALTVLVITIYLWNKVFGYRANLKALRPNDP
ncbi:hypothetical protein CO015_05170 [candidate division WWE3 bacterium CG_4_8_14_3_um_filter_42_11]|uniref:Polysaccharide biosynthesis protein C-terminal domain-containing protein n=1 Tax=candidate division WWE3 bacterium CG_4_8_14_3_um_filter_42_11 TaxID=1975076 RepID=A0A2M8G5L2_UNCKA|nr:MAG: hypothetical protein CO015_05170 [candidate division WWE3 bacterium CG_4_8_14_3_um_filter_42_11]